MKVRVIVDRPYGRLEIEGDSWDDLIEYLKSLPEYLTIIDESVRPKLEPPKEKADLKGIVEFTRDGPLLSVPVNKLTDKEAIGLLLYAYEPEMPQSKELSRLLSLSGRASKGFAARLSELKREGYIVKEGDAYRLTSIGREWVKDLLAKLGESL